MKQLIHALEKTEIEGHSVFLAGPTPRNNKATSWRPLMIQILRSMGYTGDILIPEKKGNWLEYDYTNQTNWEVEYLNAASCILFWIPREINHMPGFTTNIEYGEFMHSEKILLGFPPNTPKMRYLQVRAKMHNIPVVNTMEDAAQWVIDHTVNGIIRPVKSHHDINSCPCIYLDEPCMKNCTCVQQLSSHGCLNCCTYGSIAQRKQTAIHLNALRLKNDEV